MGLTIGDAFGAPFEGLDALTITRSFGSPHNILERPPVDALYYTDDTQMTLGVTQILIEHGRIEADALARRFGENFQPDRGYGAAAYDLLMAVRDGADWRALSRSQFGGQGSFGNGAAMRVAPVGLAFSNDPDRVWVEAGRSADITHTHPLGIEGAQLLAIAVALMARPFAPFDRSSFFGELIRRATQDEFRDALEDAACLGPEDPVSRFGTGLEAHRSVVTAIACFAASPDDYGSTIAFATSLGGDTDTLAAMAGALAGARLGADAIPRHLIDLLENNHQGREFIQNLATDFASRFA